MKLGIGIDTGGTYTDAVIMDLSNGNVLDSNKALTTYSDLLIGIKEAISGLNPAYLNEVSFAAVSTTLATNSTLEGKGYPAGLILVGYDTEKNPPSPYTVSVSGGHDPYGNEIAELDLEAVKEFVLETGDKVASYAVSSYFSVRNPEHELEVKKLIRSLTEKPVVCGHELSLSLGAYKRAVTALLNARLIPVTDQFIKSIASVMKEKGIDAPLMMMKCDGSLVRIEEALEKPVESIFSGPAASLVGAAHISNLKSCITVDVGGTSTDISLISDGIPEISDSGAVVGNWKTMVRAIRMNTSAVGGDSHVWVKGKMMVGPNRVVPLSLAASRFPGLKEKLLTCEKPSSRITDEILQPTSFFMRGESCSSTQLSRYEKEVLNALKDEPMSIFEVGKQIGSHPLIFTGTLKSLIQKRCVQQIGFTPTDALQVLGEYVKWDKETAGIGAEMLASAAGTDRESFCKNVKKAVAKNIALNLLSFFIEDVKLKDLEKVLESSAFTKFKIEVPLVLIGAPVKAYVKELGELIDAEVRIPEYHEVGNAVGTLVGSVIKRVEVLIRPVGNNQYVLFSEKGKREFEEYGDALDCGLKLSRQLVENHMDKYGLDPENVHFELDKQDIRNGDGKTLETKLFAIGVGTPSEVILT